MESYYVGLAVVGVFVEDRAVNGFSVFAPTSPLPGASTSSPPFRNDGRPDPARAVLHAAARRKLLDGGALAADSPVHPDVIRAARPSARRAIASGGVPAKDVVSQASPRRAGTRVAGAARRAVSPITKPQCPRPDGAIATRQSRSGRQMVPNRKSQLK
jgi:hypothetical protein